MKMTSRRLKDKIRNIALGDSDRSQMLFRHYFFERFLFRLSQIEEGDYFVLKGGVLISSVLGMDRRMTRDIDFTVKEELSSSELEAILSKAAQIEDEDNTSFTIESIVPIMIDRPNQGLRVHVSAQLEQTRNTFHIDVTHGDVITPYPVIRKVPFMFDDGHLEIASYPIETVIAEKFSAIVELGRATTRMRDYYDIAMLYALYRDQIPPAELKHAILSTCYNKNCHDEIERYAAELPIIYTDTTMQNLWNNYLVEYPYNEQLSWSYVLNQVESIYSETELLRDAVEYEMER